MTYKLDGPLEARDWELLFAWRAFCQEEWAASMMALTPGLATEFADWLRIHPVGDETRAAAAIWWHRRDLGAFLAEDEILQRWAEFSEALYSDEFTELTAATAVEFSNWLREPNSVDDP